jgi:DNA excision repair protein ERCC-4
MDASPFELEFQHSWQSQGGALISDLPINLEDDGLMLLDFGSDALEGEFDTNYGLLKPEETVLIRAYSDDTDDRMLTEIKPKFIVMFEPDMDFVRRVEVSLPLIIRRKTVVAYSGTGV